MLTMAFLSKVDVGKSNCPEANLDDAEDERNSWWKNNKILMETFCAEEYKLMKTF